MNAQFTTFTGEVVKPDQIVRATLHGSAWPHIITSASRCIKARPMARCGRHWEAERHVRPDDLWSARRVVERLRASVRHDGATCSRVATAR